MILNYKHPNGHNNRLETMNTGELIEFLSQFDENTPVLFAYDYGDHCHTTVCEPVTEATLSNAEYSDYHSRMKVKDIGAVKALILHSSDIEIPEAEEESEKVEEKPVPRLISNEIGKTMSVDEIDVCKRMDRENPMQ